MKPRITISNLGYIVYAVPYHLITQLAHGCGQGKEQHVISPVKNSESVTIRNVVQVLNNNCTLQMYYQIFPRFKSLDVFVELKIRCYGKHKQELAGLNSVDQSSKKLSHSEMCFLYFVVNYFFLRINICKTLKPYYNFSYAGTQLS